MDIKEPKKIKIDFKAEPNEQQGRAIHSAIIRQQLQDAMMTDSELKEYGSSARVWRDQARAWFFSQDPDTVYDRLWILSVGCGFDDPEERLGYLRELIKSGVSFKELKKEIGVK